MVQARLALLAVLTCGAADYAQAVECHVFKACERDKCLDVPGNFVQSFNQPEGGFGETTFIHGRAYVFAADKDVVTAIKAGKVSQDVRYVAYPDDTGRGGDWVDATVFAVKWLTWEGDKPSLSRATSLMACVDGGG